MQGMTLLELLITVTIAALLTTLAIPSLIGLVRDYRAPAAINGIIGHVGYSGPMETASAAPTQASGCSWGAKYAARTTRSRRRFRDH